MVDILPWDPMDLIWDEGPDGLLWACRISYQTYTEIKANHPEFRELTESEIQSTNRMMVYDYYDQTVNCVFAQDMVVKPPTRHGSPSIPVYVSLVGGRPSNTGNEWGEFHEGLERVGESCYASNRGVYPKRNAVLSMRMQLIARYTDPSYTYMSDDGNRGAEANPFLEGQEIQLRQRERIEALPFIEMARDADLFTAEIAGEEQRGSLPYSTYGGTPGVALSGYALNSLEAASRSVVMPMVRAIEKAYMQIVDKLCAQYATGFYAPISIPGQQDAQAPYLVGMADMSTVRLKPDMPTDLAAKATTAQLLREGPIPLASDAQLRTEVLEWEDEEGTQDLINAQQAERLLPSAMMRVLFESLLDRGEDEIAMEYLKQYMLEGLRQQIELGMMQMQAMSLGINPASAAPTSNEPSGGGMSGGQAGPGRGPQGSVQGVNGIFSPQSALGAPQPNPFQQAGPLVAPGTPRPRAQQQVRQGMT